MVEVDYFIKGYFFAEMAGVGLDWRFLEHSFLQLQQFILASVLGFHVFHSFLDSGSNCGDGVFRVVC